MNNIIYLITVQRYFSVLTNMTLQRYLKCKVEFYLICVVI